MKFFKYLCSFLMIPTLFFPLTVAVADIAGELKILYQVCAQGNSFDFVKPENYFKYYAVSPGDKIWKTDADGTTYWYLYAGANRICLKIDPEGNCYYGTVGTGHSDHTVSFDTGYQKLDKVNGLCLYVGDPSAKNLCNVCKS